MNYSKIDNISRNEHPNTYNGTIQYGTAGFRTKWVVFLFKYFFIHLCCPIKVSSTTTYVNVDSCSIIVYRFFIVRRADILDHVLFRMGVLAALRSKVKNGKKKISRIIVLLFDNFYFYIVLTAYISAAIGVMITASHNEEPDNGVKLVDPAGEMLESSWECIATEVANAANSELVATLQRIVADHSIDVSRPAKVIMGRDTRLSSPALASAALQGVDAAGGVAKDFGVITTPQLHYLVDVTNTEKRESIEIDEYYRKLGTAFERARSSGKDNGKYVGEVVIDAANGVGAIAAKEFAERLKSILTMRIFNEGDNALNHNVRNFSHILTLTDK